jgi:hypothetical protein
MTFTKELRLWSNPESAQKQAFKYLGKRAILVQATTKNKKYKIFDPDNEKWISFGQMGYEDYTKHKDKERRKNYLIRSANIKGNWKKNKYSPNNLSRNILW